MLAGKKKKQEKTLRTLFLGCFWGTDDYDDDILIIWQVDA